MGGGVIRMNEKKPMPDDHSWFWHEGFKDAIAGRRRDAPDPIGSLPRSWQLADYFEGYEAGEEERFPPEQNYLCRKLMTRPFSASPRSTHDARYATAGCRCTLCLRWWIRPYRSSPP